MTTPARVRVGLATEWAPLSRGVMIRSLVEEGGAALKMYRIGPGLRFPLHQHPYAELGVLLSGGGYLLLDDERRLLEAGDSFFVGPNTAHGFETPAEEETVMLNAECPTAPDGFTPVRAARRATRAVPSSTRRRPRRHA